ncbi:MAG: 16S rRNA (cytosine(1402)-N(4))-methyltransferase RsmH [Verrucomicrobiota bacterium]
MAKIRKIAAVPGASEYHAPVLFAEVVEALAPAPGMWIVDCTLGGGGHSEALLQAGANVIGIDQDCEAIAFASNRLRAFGSRFQSIHASFGDAPEKLRAMGHGELDGVLMDLGISSHQIDTPSRGFSFQADGPLDMRMNPEGLVTAADLVNTASADQLERIFRQYGEEPQARRISLRLVKDRAVQPFRTTLELANAVEAVVPRRGKTHPATRIFQALRMAVNRELEVLERGLSLFSEMLKEGGRMAVISFHSLEDRVVKQYFQRRSTPLLDRPEWGSPRRNPECIFRKVTGKPKIASDEEQMANPRSRSAKLRVVERLASISQPVLKPA